LFVQIGQEEGFGRCSLHFTGKVPRISNLAF
jgi:hypothetical protein